MAVLHTNKVFVRLKKQTGQRDSPSHSPSKDRTLIPSLSTTMTNERPGFVQVSVSV